MPSSHFASGISNFSFRGWVFKLSTSLKGWPLKAEIKHLASKLSSSYLLIMSVRVWDFGSWSRKNICPYDKHYGAVAGRVYMREEEPHSRMSPSRWEEGKATGERGSEKGLMFLGDVIQLRGVGSLGQKDHSTSGSHNHDNLIKGQWMLGRELQGMQNRQALDGQNLLFLCHLKNNRMHKIWV